MGLDVSGNHHVAKDRNRSRKTPDPPNSVSSLPLDCNCDQTRLAVGGSRPDRRRTGIERRRQFCRVAPRSHEIAGTARPAPALAIPQHAEQVAAADEIGVGADEPELELRLVAAVRVVGLAGKADAHDVDAREPREQPPPALQRRLGERHGVRAGLARHNVEHDAIGHGFGHDESQLTDLAGERYRDNSSLLDNALALDGNGIEAQYASGKAEADVKVVVMSGGGADILLGPCDAPISECPLLANAVLAAKQLLARMAEDGVEDVLFVYYPDPTDAGLREKVDTLRPLLQAACADHPTRCHWVDLRRAFEGHPDYLVDGINPSPAGSRASAAEIWSAMRHSCAAQ